MARILYRSLGATPLVAESSVFDGPLRMECASVSSLHRSSLPQRAHTGTVCWNSGTFILEPGRMSEWGFRNHAGGNGPRGWMANRSRRIAVAYQCALQPPGRIGGEGDNLDRDR